MLKALLNPNQPTNQCTCCMWPLFLCTCTLHV